MNVQLARTNFLAYCRVERQLSDNTLSAYEQDLKEFCRFFGNRPVSDIGGAELVAYSQHLVSRRKSAPATTKRRLACVRAMFVRLRRQQIIATNPFADVDLRIRIPARLPRCLGAAEARALLQEGRRASSTTYLSVLILFATGIRISELASIRLRDIDLEQCAIRIVGKGDRERRVYLSDQTTISVLRAYIAKMHPGHTGSERLFINDHRRPANAACLRRRISCLAQIAGLSRTVTPHMIRHTTATILIETGVDIRLVQRLLGHHSIATTQIYTHVSDRALKAAIAAANIHRAIGLSEV